MLKACTYKVWFCLLASVFVAIASSTARLVVCPALRMEIEVASSQRYSHLSKDKKLCLKSSTSSFSDVPSLEILLLLSSNTEIAIASKIVVYEEGERRPSPVLECRIDQETTERKDDGPLQQDNPEQL